MSDEASEYRKLWLDAQRRAEIAEALVAELRTKLETLEHENQMLATQLMGDG